MSHSYFWIPEKVLSGIISLRSVITVRSELKEKNQNTSDCFLVHRVLQEQALDAPLNSKPTPPAARWFFSFVGVAGFEPTTSSSRTKRAAGLRYTPQMICYHRISVIPGTAKIMNP